MAADVERDHAVGLSGGHHLNLADASDEELAERATAAMLKFSQWFAARMREKGRKAWRARSPTYRPAAKPKAAKPKPL